MTTRPTKVLAERLASEHRRAERERLEDTLAFQLQARKIRGYRREVEWHPRRNFRSDFLWPEERVIVEVEGGQWTQGRHQRGGGMERDAVKYNEASLMGFMVLRFVTGQVVRGEAVDVIERALVQRREEGEG